MCHGRLDFFVPSQFQESILPPKTRTKIPAQLTESGIKKKEKTMIFAVVEVGPIPHTCAGILEQFMWARNPIGTELS
jgi:hypothetical protein